MPLKDKAYAALCAFALGDAMGMPTELISPAEIKDFYGHVDTLIEPDPRHYHAVDMHRGMITDDTELTLEVMDALIRNGGVSVEAAVDTMLVWSKKCDVLNKTYLGPSSKRALEAIANGLDPAEAGKRGTTDGAPMRILPIGILNAGDPERAADDAATFCIPTHGSNIAMSAACAIAAAVAEALTENDGIYSGTCPAAGPDTAPPVIAVTNSSTAPDANLPASETNLPDASATNHDTPPPTSPLARVIEAARKGAAVGEARGFYIRENRLLPLLDELLTISASEPDDARFLAQAYTYFETSMEADLITPVILTLFVRYRGDPMRVITAAANIGGDTDTIGAIAGGLSGAFSGASSLDADMLREVEQINQIDLYQKTEEFLAFCRTRPSV